MFYFIVRDFRSSRSQVLYKEAVPKNVAIFHRKYLCRSLFCQAAGLRLATLLKKRIRHRCFSANFVRFLRTVFCRTTVNGYLRILSVVVHFWTWKGVVGNKLKKLKINQRHYSKEIKKKLLWKRFWCLMN